MTRCLTSHALSFIKAYIQRFPYAHRNDGGIFVYRKRHRPLEAVRPVMSTRKPRLNGSAIQASCGPAACLPPATTAASMRSRRWPGSPLMSKTVTGIRFNCSDRGTTGNG